MSPKIVLVPLHEEESCTPTRADITLHWKEANDLNEKTHFSSVCLISSAKIVKC